MREIEISAKKYEYDPATIEVAVNTLVKIHLKALDREHGFEIKSIKDSCVKFKPNESATVEFYADKAGGIRICVLQILWAWPRKNEGEAGCQVNRISG